MRGCYVKRHLCLIADRGSARAVRVSLRPSDRTPRRGGSVALSCSKRQCVRGARGALLAGHESCHACTLLRCSLLLAPRVYIFWGRPRALPDPDFVVLWIEAFEGSDFLEGARTHQGSRVRFHCYLEKFCATFTPHFCGVLLLRIFAEYFYSAFLRSTFTPHFCGVLFTPQICGVISYSLSCSQA